MTTNSHPVTWLMLFTLVAAFIVVAVAFAYHLRSRRNRAIASDALAGDRLRADTVQSGALPDLAGMAAIAVVAMMLLSLGYANKGYTRDEAAQSATAAQTAPIAPAPATR